MDVDQQGPMFGPQTHADAMIEDIHERRARALEELNGRLHDAYNHGPEELVCSLQAQIDWWHSVIWFCIGMAPLEFTLHPGM